MTRFTERLSRTPAILRAVIEGQPDSWLDSKHADDVFSPREAVAHLVLCEGYGSWIDRIRRVLDPECVVPSDDMSEVRLLADYAIPELLDRFESLRGSCTRELLEMHLTEDDLKKVRVRSEAWTESVDQLLNTWIAHDLYHIGQIFRSYSALYTDQIGPYQKYLNLPHFN